MKWGYGIVTKRSIDLDSNDMTIANKLQEAESTLISCIACGCCTATCTAGYLTDFNFRQLHTLVRRGEYDKAREEAEKCMLCGKCFIICPRGINTRNVILTLRRIL